MSYFLIIPLEYFEKLIQFRKWFKQSVRSQILEAIESYINDVEIEMMEKVTYFFSFFFCNF